MSKQEQIQELIKRVNQLRADWARTHEACVLNRLEEAEIKLHNLRIGA